MPGIDLRQYRIEAQPMAHAGVDHVARYIDGAVISEMPLLTSRGKSRTAPACNLQFGDSSACRPMIGG